MGQVWSKANFDGLNETGYLGGRGSVLAVTAQNPGSDGIWGTGDDLITPLNKEPADVSIDWTPGPDNQDLDDRVRGFYSQHAAGSIFAMSDGSTRFVSESIDLQLYQDLSTRAGGEVIVDGEF